MSFFSRLRNRTSKRGRAQHRPAAPRFRPQLEALEGREVPSTLTVIDTLDTGSMGDGSLRGEIAVAHSGDTIKFAIPTTDPGYNPATGAFTIGLSGDELWIDKNLTIQGPGAGLLTISGGGVYGSGVYGSRVFEVAAGVSATLTNLMITGGSGIAEPLKFDPSPGDGLGGGILNLGNLTLQNCTVSGNTCQLGPNYGGGIYNAGTLSVTGCTLSGNSAVAGGAIYNASKASAIVMNSTLSENTAYWVGGGIYTCHGAKLKVGGDVFSNNTPDNIFRN
jgi:hypothetical protein